MNQGSALIVGLGITGRAVAEALVAHGVTVTAVDDRLPADAAAADQWATAHGIDVHYVPTAEALASYVARADAIFPAPGLPETHPVFALAAATGTPLRSEFDLAAAWDTRPCVAITGTDGKTTVTTLVTAMFEASGLRAMAVGNTPTPLVAALADPSIDVFVVEASSFRLATTSDFRPRVGTWLNFADDHQDVHTSLGGYEAAKARLWRGFTSEQLAVANADDPVVMAHAAGLPRVETFGLHDADWHLEGDQLCTPTGEVLVGASELDRALPHDLANALAASATALGGGATLDGVRAALRAFRGLPHRVELVGEAGGVRYYDDSKATAPHATLAAVSSFDSVVLLAGGRNKGLDLGALAGLAPRLRSVVAIGEAAPDIVSVFADVVPVQSAESMAVAVGLAAAAAHPGDVVLLSPGCASYDWYDDYAQRGEDFTRLVHDLIGVGA